jgi:hypothetical protein
VFTLSLHEIRHKARLVAGGHLTDPNTTGNTYSSIVSLCSMLIAIDAAELNELDTMVGDVSSPILKHTPKKRYVS